MEEFVIKFVLPNLKQDSAHDVNHFRKVRDHALQAVEETQLEQWQKDAIVHAAFLHDLDDRKLTKGVIPVGHDSWVSFVLDRFSVPHADIIKKMIDLVSSSKWGDRRDDDSPDWYYLPRYCDRLEAIGLEGVRRVIDYSLAEGRSLHNEETERVENEEQLRRVATTERYEEYTTGRRTSATALDHFYDKLLHTILPDWVDNAYLAEQFATRQQETREWVYNYWSKQ